MVSSTTTFMASFAMIITSSMAFFSPSAKLAATSRHRGVARAATCRPTSLRMATPQLAYTLENDVIEGPLQPVGNYILVKLFPVVSRTAGGVVLPDQAKEAPVEGLVIAAGPGRTHPFTGELIPMCVADGDTVLFSKWSGRKLKYNGEDHMFILDDDLVLVYRGEELTVDTLKMVRDQVLVEVEKGETQTDAGIVIAAETASRERSSQGKVVAIGEGRTTSKGTIAECPFKPGDTVKFFEYAPIEIKIKGKFYAVVRMVDCLARWE